MRSTDAGDPILSTRGLEEVLRGGLEVRHSAGTRKEVAAAADDLECGDTD
jgi:hypothetical protein